MAKPTTAHSNDCNTSRLIVLTDLDGTLLDSETYSFDAATAALDALRARSIPVILVSSKTRAEIEPLRSRLHNNHPFIVENGGAVLIPSAYFPFPITDAITSGPYLVIGLGTPYTRLRQALKDIERDLGVPLRGYGDMSVDEVARRTGLSFEDATLAKQRDYDEPFIVEGQESTEQTLAQAIAEQGLRWTTGDRFHHLMGVHDKGAAVRRLIDCYRHNVRQAQPSLTMLALGNSLNDLPMLAVADTPILVQLADGTYAAGLDLPGLIRAPAPGPAGWNQAVLSLIR
ncbi:MAG: HAD-IIB family hydrolase [Nitrospira sp.]|nr:HAD-IIB family hydrolase [Nitrospira sp.]